MSDRPLSHGLVETGSDWREQVETLTALVEGARQQLIEAETRLAEKIAAVNAFEFKLRSVTRPLLERLDQISAEITSLRQELRRLQDDLLLRDLGPADEAFDDTSFRFTESATDTGFRYRGTTDSIEPPGEAADLDPALRRQLKRLYRQLARRFHPDLAPDEAERAYRTDLMMRINAAYTRGDLAALEELAQAPDRAGAFSADSDAQKASMLLAELERCRRRLAEIEEELARLEAHRSARLMRRAARYLAQGRDLLNEIAGELRGQIARRLAERDLLRQEIDSFDASAPDLDGERLADAVFEMGLEWGLEDEDDWSGDLADEWRPRWSATGEWAVGEDDEDLY